MLDEQYTRTPFYGSRRMQVALAQAGHAVNRKHVHRLMRLMGLEAVGPKPRLRMTSENLFRPGSFRTAFSRSLPVRYSITSMLIEGITTSEGII